MKRVVHWIIVLAAAFATTLPAQEPESPDAGEPDTIAVDDVLERARRALRINPANAEIWLQGIEKMDHPVARLERALLLGLGPDNVRDRGQSVRMLNNLLDGPAPGVRLDDSAVMAVQVLVSMLATQAALAEEYRNLHLALTDERRAHQDTLEKLESLRAIEQQLGERDDNGGDG